MSERITTEYRLPDGSFIDMYIEGNVITDGGNTQFILLGFTDAPMETMDAAAYGVYMEENLSILKRNRGRNMETDIRELAMACIACYSATMGRDRLKRAITLID